MKGNAGSVGVLWSAVTPGTKTMRGTRVATSKFEYLAHSPCSPRDQPADEEERGMKDERSIIRVRLIHQIKKNV